MIGIIDYGMGNLHSVKNALDALGFANEFVSDPKQLDKYEKLVLPGVGAFGDCMENLHRSGLYKAVDRQVRQKKKPLLGICLGMQALFETSEEKGFHQGFGFLQGDIRKMEAEGYRIPHIGWNELVKNGNHPLLDQLPDHAYMYYVHSYYAQNYREEDLLGYSIYGPLKIPGIVCHDNVLGCQFHPEKCGEDGLKILRYFGKEFV